jgi:hypothetical protein
MGETESAEVSACASETPRRRCSFYGSGLSSRAFSPKAGATGGVARTTTERCASCHDGLRTAAGDPEDNTRTSAPRPQQQLQKSELREASH